MTDPRTTILEIAMLPDAEFQKIRDRVDYLTGIGGDMTVNANYDLTAEELPQVRAYIDQLIAKRTKVDPIAAMKAQDFEAVVREVQQAKAPAVFFNEIEDGA